MTWYSETQAKTRATATRHNETWILADVEFVSAFSSEPDAELAVTLGRTLASITWMKHELRKGYTPSDMVRTPAKAERGYTFIGDDVPEGW